MPHRECPQGLALGATPGHCAMAGGRLLPSLTWSVDPPLGAGERNRQEVACRSWSWAAMSDPEASGNRPDGPALPWAQAQSNLSSGCQQATTQDLPGSPRGKCSPPPGHTGPPGPQATGWGLAAGQAAQCCVARPWLPAGWPHAG